MELKLTEIRQSCPRDSQASIICVSFLFYKLLQRVFELTTVRVLSIRQAFVLGEVHQPLMEVVADWSTVPDIIWRISGF